MNSKDYLEIILKERYEFEFEEKDRIEAKIALPVAIFTFLSSSLIYYVKNPITYTCTVGCIIFLIISFIFIVAMLSTVFFTMRTLIPYYNKHITEPAKLQKYYDELIEYYSDKKDSNEQEMDTLLLNKLKQAMKDEYQKSAQFNSDNNEKKGKYLFYARVSMFVSIFSLVISSIIYFSIMPK